MSNNVYLLGTLSTARVWYVDLMAGDESVACRMVYPAQHGNTIVTQLSPLRVHKESIWTEVLTLKIHVQPDKISTTLYLLL